MKFDDLATIPRKKIGWGDEEGGREGRGGLEGDRGARSRSTRGRSIETNEARPDHDDFADFCEFIDDRPAALPDRSFSLLSHLFFLASFLRSGDSPLAEIWSI